MAKNTVEYYSSSLGSGVINNAASDATIREIIAAYNNMSGGSNTDLISDTDDNIKATNKVLSSASKAFSSLAAGLVNTVTAGKNFTSMLVRGEDKLSSYSKFLEQDVIKKLPIVGDALGGFASIITTSISILESWNDDLKQATQHGATFSNDMFEFKATAIRMGLSTDELLGLLSENSEKISSLGIGTVTSGMRNFSKISEKMFMENVGVAEILDKMGYSSQQQNEMLLDYYWNTRRGNMTKEKEFNKTSSGFLSYASQLDVYQKITGKSRVDRLKATAAASEDLSYQLKIGKLGKDERARMELALNGIAMVFGTNGAELFKARELNMTTMNDTALALSIALGPNFEKAIGDIQAMAKTKNMDDKVFNNALNNLLGDQLANAEAAYKRLEPFLKSAISGNERAKQTVQGLTPVMEYLAKQGKMSPDIRNQFLEQIKAAKAEQAKTDAFTDTLRKFQRAVMRVYNTLVKSFFPVFKDLAREFKLAMIPQMINDFGSQLQELAKDAIPAIKNFISNMSSPEGMAIVGDAFSHMFRGMKLYLRGLVTEAFQDRFLPPWAQRILRDKGLINDPSRLKQVGKDFMGFGFEQGKQLLNPEMSVVNTDQRFPSVTIGDTTHYIGGLMRGADGFYRSSTDVGTSVSGMNTVKNLQIEEAIARQRERQSEAKGNAEFAGDPKDFGGLTFLQREALSQYFTHDVIGMSRGLEKYAPYLASPQAYSQADQYQRNYINSFLTNPNVKQNIEKLKKAYPNTFLGMNTGTLGTVGSLFANFGKGTRATLHGKEAIVTPKQLQSVIGAGTQISVRDVVNRLNNNINLMISVAKEDVRLERSKLMAMT